ncbi:Arc family DNA-binding protein [Calothrix sp. FACHB-156]|nr:Arc family DNA-binding protein [Nostoc linckia FACHB-104]MBD2340077.1 Arc family DNA-binding protein [Calothrix sp. FACHB-156]
MANLNLLNIPDDLYEKLQELAQAEHRSIDAQVVTILQNALAKKTQQTEEEKRKNVLKLLEESRMRREKLPKDIKWPDSTTLLREDRDR